MNRDQEWLLKEKYRGEKSEAFFADCERLVSGEPLAYVIGSIPFLDCNIYLDSRPLIPRPETEFWVEQAIKALKSAIRVSSHPLRILDLCAGSGAIGIAVAKAIPQAHVTFAELDATHLPTIQQNLQSNSIDTSRYTVVASDLFHDVTGPFDFILSNPPYIDKEANTVEESVATHEPHLALFGGHGGLALIEKIIAAASNYLTKDGHLWLEHEPFQAAAIAAQGAHHGFSTATHADQYQCLRYSVLTPK